MNHAPTPSDAFDASLSITSNQSPHPVFMNSNSLQIRNHLKERYRDVYTDEVLSALSALSRFNSTVKEVMDARIKRRAVREKDQEKIKFLDPRDIISRTKIKVQEAREGKFEGAVIPRDLQCQWIQGTGPAAKPNAPIESSIRNIAYALLSGADGWMFDGEDALGQITTMSLDNQRNLKLAIHGDPLFLKTAEQVAAEMNRWSMGFFGRKIIDDWKEQLKFTTKIFRARGLHLDDRHIRDEKGVALAASIVDITLYVVNNYQTLQRQGSSIVLYLPKIQTAEEAAVWDQMLLGLEQHLGLPEGTIKGYVLVEQLEAT
ncbi:MAG: malate synthase, partial [Cyclobacteriaceae bacterium]